MDWGEAGGGGEMKKMGVGKIRNPASRSMAVNRTITRRAWLALVSGMLVGCMISLGQVQRKTQGTQEEHRAVQRSHSHKERESR